MVQHHAYPIESDPIEKGQTVEFRIQGVSFSIYGRVISPSFVRDGYTYSTVMTFVDCEKLDVRHDDMARRVMRPIELNAIIHEYSPARWG